MKFGMNHIHIKAEDPRSTAQWYVDKFGASGSGRGGDGRHGHCSHGPGRCATEHNAGISGKPAGRFFRAAHGAWSTSALIQTISTGRWQSWRARV